MHDESTRFRFDLIGDLSKDTAQDLEQACQTASSVFNGRCLVVDLTRVTSVDHAGRQLLEEWHARGAQLVAASPGSKRRIQSMTTMPITLASAEPESSQWLRRTATLGLAGLWAALMLATAVAAVARQDGGGRWQLNSPPDAVRFLDTLAASGLSSAQMPGCLALDAGFRHQRYQITRGEG
jgi:ABC-type transporter Mla MlaB component